MTREEAIKRLKEYAKYSYGIWHNDEEDPKAFDMAIEVLQAEIVRCKDCKYHNGETKGCTRNPSVEKWENDDYCSYGERREE